MNAHRYQARLSVFVTMLGLAVVFRLFPFVLTSAGYTVDESYPWSFSPILPVCLYGAACLGSRTMALLGPMLAWFVGDIAIWLVTGAPEDAFYASQPFNYLAFAACVAGGFWLRGRMHLGALAGLGIATPALFFLISNFGVWLASPLYPRTLAGLWECYLMGLPFVRYAFLSQLVFLPILFSPIALRDRAPTISRKVAA